MLRVPISQAGLHADHSPMCLTMLCKCTIILYCNAALCKKVRHYFCHSFVWFTFNLKLSFLFYYMNLPKGELVIQLASNNVGCISEQIWKEQCRMKVYTTINMTKWRCPRIGLKLVNTTKNFFYLRYASKVTGYHWLHVSKGRTILLQWCDLTSSSDGSTSSGDVSTILSASDAVKNMIKNRISSETHNWYVYATWEIELQNLGFTQMTSQGGVEGQNILLILTLMCFLWNNL